MDAAGDQSAAGSGEKGGHCMKREIFIGSISLLAEIGGMEHHIPGWPDADGSGFSGAAGDRRTAVWIGCAGCLVNSGCQFKRREDKA